MKSRSDAAQRKGVTHVLESIIAALLLFFFVLAVMPTANQPSSQDSAIDDRAYHTLAALDTAGKLQKPAVNGNASDIKQIVEPHLPGRQIEIALFTLNATSKELDWTNQHTASFSVPETAETETLRIWLDNTTNLTVGVNGQQLATYTGNRQNTYEKIDISGATTTGANTLNLTVSSPSHARYSIDRYYATQTGAPPSTADARTTSYMVGGSATTFTPVEVTIISWQ